MSEPRLLALATAPPPYRYAQAEVRDAAPLLFDRDSADLHRLLPVFDNAGIAARHSCVPLEWYMQPHGWVERSRLFREHAVELLTQATLTCLERAGLSTGDIDAVVAVSTTGVATPSLDALIVERLKLGRGVKRLPIFGLGCAGGVIGLSRAVDLARAHPGARVLYLVVELCALTFRHGDNTKSNVVAAALFGDGAAAALISTEGEGPSFGVAGEHSFPEFPGCHGLAGQRGRTRRSLLARHSRSGAQRVQGGAGGFPEPLRPDARRSRRHHLSSRRGEGSGRAGGELRAAPGAMTVAREVLRDCGNMSAATVLFVPRAHPCPTPTRALSDVGAGPRLQRRIPDDRGLSLLPTILLLLAALRILELTIARRNTRRLLAEGAVEAGNAHYPLIIALHLAWFLALLLLVPPGRAPQWPWLLLFLLLQPLRLWVIATLGRFWTTRVISAHRWSGEAPSASSVIPII